MSNIVSVSKLRTSASEVPIQSASMDIWDTKYRLKAKDGLIIDESIDETWQRVARALAEVEESEELRGEWYERFLWALRHGAIPAGRIISNAGAQAHKPSTSTINCTVSDTIADSMDQILRKVHEAGLTLKAGCVAPGTLVRTEHGLVTADRAVAERHARILCYDREAGRFEMRPVLDHMTTHVPREENIEIESNGARLLTSIKHPVLVYRDEELIYVRADEVREDDALVHYTQGCEAEWKVTRWMDAWFAGSRSEAIPAATVDGTPVRGRTSANVAAGSATAMIDWDNGSQMCDVQVSQPHREQHASRIRQYDACRIPLVLQSALEHESASVSHRERQALGFYHGYHRRRIVSRVWLDRWEARFPQLAELIALARTLRPVQSIRRALPVAETFYDFTVEKHNNYLAGNDGLMVIHNCGIGYEFSTLRHRGAYVSGAGAYTSGSLSFMDIYDRMCFTVSSAGGRRGAQMATFDIGHPDVLDFIRAKREDGRLRQFNLSLLITDEFMDAVRQDANWPLAFPISPREAEADGVRLDDPAEVIWREWPIRDGYITNEKGLVACRVQRTVKARHLWNMIMTATYDYAEPGFVLIDRVNEMNNNWFCEEIRATNPCVTADTRLHTQHGLVRAGDLHAAGCDIEATVDKRALHGDRDGGESGVETRPAVPMFQTAASADVYRVVTEDGYEIKATAWHDFYTERGKIQLDELEPGTDRILIQSGKGQFGSEGSGELGVLLGLITGEGHFTKGGAGHEAVRIEFRNDERELAASLARYVNSLIAKVAANGRRYHDEPTAIPERNRLFIRSVLLARVLEHFGFTPESRLRVPEVIWRGSEACVKGYLRALFQADGTVDVCSVSQSCTVRLASSRPERLREVQMLLANFGVFSGIRTRRPAGRRDLPDAHEAVHGYACKGDHELIIDGESREVFMREIGFLSEAQEARYHEWVADKVPCEHQRFASRVTAIEYVGREPVFDTTQADQNTVIFNGLVTGQCGEQPLPPFGSCLLGSINLTKFVRDPFTPQARFDWDEYREVVRVFTRMLDNVVEINGLPLPEQRNEIERKRRHGMGFLGLGSTVTMLRMRYGDPDSLKFTEEVSREMALEGWRAGVALAEEKGPAPIMEEEFEVTDAMLAKRPELAADAYTPGDRLKGRELLARYSRYMQRIGEVDPELVDRIAERGARFTHHSSIAPTGTISLSLANNASNGIEPSFAHHYFRNVIREGKKSKEKIDVFSFELLAYRAFIDDGALPSGDQDAEGSTDTGGLPDYFVTADDITPKQHVDIQAAAQKWVDSSISKTANVPTDYPFEEFKDIYRYAYEQGLKGCTTFRFNPEAFQGVLVTEKDMASTTYRFKLEDGSYIEAKGGDEIEYDGETHTAANLFEALKEGYYGKF